MTLYKLLARLGGPKGIIRQSEFFLYTDKDKQAVRKCLELGLPFPEVTSWIRANEKDFELVKEMGLQETGILVSCSDYHGFVVPFATELMNLAKESGIRIKIRACDTLGYGVSFPGVALPRSVPGIMYGLRHYADVPSAWLEWHGHNDFYKVVTNADAAWLYGCSSVNCALLGIGERTGNCPLEAMAIEYAQLRGTQDGMDFTAITDIAEFFEKDIGYVVPPRTPFVGRAFNSTRAGIHADGLLKDEEIYNIFDTAKILNRPATVAVDSHSGLAGIAHWMNGYFNLKGENTLDKRHAIVAAVKEKVDAEYAAGRNTVMGDEELEQMVFAADPEFFEELMAHKRVL